MPSERKILRSAKANEDEFELRQGFITVTIRDKSNFIATNNNILKLKVFLGKTLNNREYLIQILLKLRSIGIKNDKILGAIEKIPPHFYYNLLNPNNDIKKIDIDEVLEIAKLLQLSLKDNFKKENILLWIKSGWLLLLLTNFCKRVYGICNSMAKKKN